MDTWSKLLLLTHPYTQWAAEAERWGQAHWATGQLSTEVLCSLECSLAHSLTLILSLDLWPDWDTKLRYWQSKWVTISGIVYIWAETVTWSVLSNLDILMVPSWLWLVSVINWSVLVEHPLKGLLNLALELKCLKNWVMLLMLFHNSKKGKKSYALYYSKPFF